MLTASDQPQYERVCMQEGAFDYLSDIWTFRELNDRIQVALTYQNRVGGRNKDRPG